MRLPNKSILKIKDKYTIEYVIDSVKKSKYADEIVLCTTKRINDTMLCDIAEKNNIKFLSSPFDKKSIDLLLNLAKVLNPPPNLFDNPPANITNIILSLLILNSVFSS